MLVVMLYAFVFQNFPAEKPHQPSTNNNSTDNSSLILTEENIKEIKERENITFSSIKTSTLENYPLTSKPNFKIGEKCTYNIKYPSAPMPYDPNVIINDYIYFNVTFEVKDRKKINKTDWYLISPDGTVQVIAGYININGVVHPIRRTMISSEEIEYINTENGEIVGGELDRFSIYYPWMLKLSKDLKWTEKTEENSTGGGGIVGTNGKYLVSKKNLNQIREETYEVKDIEKINGRNCFKVESRLKSCTNQKCSVNYKKLFWIDIEKRITVKFQLWYENLNTMNVDLVRYKQRVIK